MSYWNNRRLAFKYAFRGLGDLLRNHPHAHWHLAATSLVVVSGLYLSVSRLEWASLLLSMGLVWVAEALNTALEYLTDLASPDFHPLAGKAKDMAAAAVLCAAIFAFVVGAIVFLPACWARLAE